MALSDITQRINNASAATDSRVQSSVRQTTLFDALNTAQRRSKRQRQSEHTAQSKDHTNSENISPCVDGKQAKRICIGSPRRVRTECAGIAPKRVLILGKPQEQHLGRIKHSIAPAPPTCPAFGQCSMITAIRQRRHQVIAPCTVSTISRLESLVSPNLRTFRLQSTDEPQLVALPLACKYSNNAKACGKLSLVDEGGNVSIFDTFREQEDTSSQQDLEGLQPMIQWKAHDNSIFDFEWSPCDDQIVTASADETCRLWDVERQQMLGLFNGHTQTVRSVSWQHNSQHCFSTASRDGSIMVWDVRCNKTAASGEHSYRPVNTIARAHHDLRSSKKPARGKHNVIAGSVTAIKHLRHDANVIASAGSTNEVIKFWDMRMTAPTRSTALPMPIASSLLVSTTKRSRGIASLSLDPDGTRLYAACNDNAVYIHNALALGQPVSQLGAPEFRCNSFNIGTSMSPCGSYLAAGSASGNAVIWELDRYGLCSKKTRAVLEGHGKEVGCVAWYPGKDRVQLATSGDDGTLRVWDLDPKLAEEGKADPMRKYCWGFSRICREPPL
ncbi:hypothetical protein IW140_001758 [Coemansia sp. RSA 1813]|nr:hypothetical protein EV178_002971 [Coemansia sp. RSA 1646]KAJ1769196.1 hypothetical protein LPJ74_004257 [Coemansia sp. RSA 1843]KAJ2090870.1 hypothetical protein IW138_002273 [Coemansia sp. RSA 986]KAJ2213185.1 hypothetical protein EV179_004060 [Coemansia sp. RSA 487]KAJ2571303.1 hypothetical protein IW140_001758 [Coemansia sp. RSA 1813]